MNEVVPGTLDGERVDRVVSMLTDLPRAKVAELVANGDVTVDGQPVKSRSTKVTEGQQLAVTVPEMTVAVPMAEDDIDFTVLHSDEHVIVVDKPAGLVVHPGAGHDSGTLVHGLLQRFPDMAERLPGDAQRPGIVHRLDAGTSGVLVVARTQEAYDVLVADLKQRKIERRYLTLLWGNLQPDTGMIDAPIARSESDRTKMAVLARGKAARTRYNVLARHDDPKLSLVAAQLDTGRTHQIRVHFSAMGFPVVGDRRYGGLRMGVEMTRPFLHARSLRLTHPVSGESLHFESPIPMDLVSVLHRLGMTTFS